jgi:hypothetical protein
LPVADDRHPLRLSTAPVAGRGLMHQLVR